MVVVTNYSNQRPVGLKLSGIWLLQADARASSTCVGLSPDLWGRLMSSAADSAAQLS
jgi:hypothetical protein